MKKLLLLLLLSVLTFGSVKDIYADGGGVSFELPFRCSCGGNYLEYYNVPNIYRWRSITHSIYNSEMYNNCGLVDFGRSANGDKCYFVKLFAGSDLFDYYSFVIYVSDDNIIELYDNVGNVINKTSSDFNNGLNFGESNGKYFGFIGSVEGYGSSYTHHYDDGYNYSITISSYSTSKIIELARFLCGEITDLPYGYEIIQPEAIYDLECPLDVKVNTGSATVNVESDSYTNIKSGSATLIPYKIWWSQSNIDLTGYVTEFYVKEFGRCRKNIFSKWEECSSTWVYDGEHVTAKFCNNNLKYHEFRCWESETLKEIAITQLGDDEPKVEFNSCDFMIRNKKEDENGVLHYSNWVYVNTYEDGTYSVYEMVQDYDITEDSDETGNINTDSTIHDDEIIHVDDSDTSIDVGGIGNAGTFLTVLKDLANSIKTFPDFFGEVFSFLPSWILTSIGILFIIVLVCAIF